MIKAPSKKLLLCSVFLGTFIAAQAVLPSFDACAGERTRKSAVTGSGGRSLSSEKIINRSAGQGRSASNTVTTGQGNAYTKTRSGAYNQETGAYERNVTGYNGNTRTSSTNVDKDSKTVTTTGTTQNGQTYSRMTGYGDGQKTTTYTGANGQTATKTTGYEQGDDGSHNRTSTLTTGSGETYTKSSSGTYNPETGAYERSVTGYHGGTRTSATSVDKDAKTVTTTGTTQKGGTYTGTAGVVTDDNNSEE